LYAVPDYIQKNKGVVQALSNAIVRSLKWLQTAGPKDLLQNVPEVYLMGDRGFYLATYNKLRESIALDGLVLEEAAKLSLKVMANFDSTVKSEKIDINKTYSNAFAKQSKLHFDA
jgi:NitT/TauT family transport system substrate-binding protein